jgi:UrcA family protein
MCQQRLITPSREIKMNTQCPTLHAGSCICLAALAACAVLASPVHAKDQQVLVNIPVDIRGLDLSQPAAAREVYRRIQRAAHTACTRGNRVDLAPPANYFVCYEKALGETVGSAHQVQLSTVYLESHTPRDAVTYSIEATVQMASQ